MKVLVGAFNQEKALVGAVSVIVQLHRLIDLRHYWSPDEAVQQLVAGELLDQPDAHHPVLAVVRRPLDVHDVVQGRGQLKVSTSRLLSLTQRTLLDKSFN